MIDARVDAQVVAQAKKLRARAVTEVLQSQVAQIYRIAYALSGRWDRGRTIARFVLNRSVRMMPKWDPEDDPANWFQRFTVQTSRRYANDKVKKDVLIEQASSVDAPYVAFAAALRHLVPQQREAFLLRYGEKLNSRYCALAMDCSTEAAENHLRAGEQAMRLIAGQSYDALLRRMIDAYAHLTPEVEQLRPTVEKVVFRRVTLRKLVRALATLLMLAIIASIAWLGWKAWKSF